MIDQIKLSAVNNYRTVRERLGPLGQATANVAVALPGVIVALLATNQWVQLVGVAWALLNLLPILQWVVMGQ